MWSLLLAIGRFSVVDVVDGKKSCRQIRGMVGRLVACPLEDFGISLLRAHCTLSMLIGSVEYDISVDRVDAHSSMVSS